MASCPDAILDPIDVRILGCLQADASNSMAELALKVSLSANACWKRVKRLEELGIIFQRVALLSREKLGLDVLVFVLISAPEHSEAWAREFCSEIKKMPEVVEFYRMNGDIDYLLKVIVRDVASYDRFYRRLISGRRFADVRSTIALEQIKATTAVPLVNS